MDPIGEALPRPLALVISGGASLGALQAGQLRALLRDAPVKSPGICGHPHFHA